MVNEIHTSDLRSAKTEKSKKTKKVRRPIFAETMLICGYMAYISTAVHYFNAVHDRRWAHEAAEPWKTLISIGGGIVWPLIAAPYFADWLAEKTGPEPSGRHRQIEARPGEQG